MRIEGYTGVGTNTKNQFFRIINDDYQIDCGGVMPVTSKCDYHKGPPEEPMQIMQIMGTGCHTRQKDCTVNWDCGYLRSTEARDQCVKLAKKGNLGNWPVACYKGCLLDQEHSYCPAEQDPCKDPGKSVPGTEENHQTHEEDLQTH